MDGSAGEHKSGSKEGVKNMDQMSFLSRRFGTNLEGPIKFGDEIIDNYGMKAVVVRDPYPVGMNAELFTLLYYGDLISSMPVSKLRKTGRSYANELNTIFNGLKEEK